MSAITGTDLPGVNPPELANALIERQATGWARSVMIIATAIGLMGIGAVMTFSAKAGVDSLDVSALWQTKALRQMLYVVAGVLTMLVASRVPYRFWASGRGMTAIVGLMVAIGVSMLVFVPGIGKELNQARRWIKLPGGMQFQPSELVKIMLPVFLAAWMTRKKPDAGLGGRALGDGRADIQHFFRGLVPVLIMIGLAVGVVGIEDFGTAALLAAVSGAMLLVGGARITHLFLLILPTVPAFGYLLMSRSHRMERLMTFRNIWEDPQNKGYQVVQSLCAIASGGLYGRGLGRGFIKCYLPEAESDFIFSVVCEELGLIGAVAVIALLIAFMWQCRLIIRDCADPMGRLLAFGIAMTIGVQAAMNIAVVTVSVPTKGIALPMISAGGSGVIFLGALVGVLASVSRYGGLVDRGKT